MYSKKQILEFIDSLHELKKWSKEELEIIEQLRHNVERSETIGHIKHAITEVFKALPQLIKMFYDSGGD